MFGDKVTFVQSLYLSLFAMIVVFIVLLLISYVIDLVANITSKSKLSKSDNNKKKTNLTSAKTSFIKKEQKLDIKSNIDMKDLAIITSCIDSFQKDTNPNYIIKSIK